MFRLGNHCIATSRNSFSFQLGSFKAGKHDQRNPRTGAFQLARELKPVHARHREIQYDQVRFKFPRHFQGSASVGCLAAYSPIVMILFKTGSQCTAYEWAIVGNKNRVGQNGLCPEQAAGRGPLVMQVGGRRVGENFSTLLVPLSEANTVIAVLKRTFNCSLSDVRALFCRAHGSKEVNCKCLL